jgi:hypothetical protein
MVLYNTTTYSNLERLIQVHGFAKKIKDRTPDVNQLR